MISSPVDDATLTTLERAHVAAKKAWLTYAGGTDGPGSRPVAARDRCRAEAERATEAFTAAVAEAGGCWRGWVIHENRLLLVGGGSGAPAPATTRAAPVAVEDPDAAVRAAVARYEAAAAYRLRHAAAGRFMPEQEKMDESRARRALEAELKARGGAWGGYKLGRGGYLAQPKDEPKGVAS